MVIDNILNELVNGLLKLYDGKVDKIVLYGSYARGTQTSESDIDVAVLLNAEVSEDIKDKVNKFEAGLSLKNDCILSVIDIDSNHYKEWLGVYPFYKNIEEEGVVLWKVA